MKTSIRIFSLLSMILMGVSVALGGAPDERSWVRLRYEVTPSAGVPAASYTIIETLSKTRSQRARVLFSDAVGHNLRVDLRVKPSRQKELSDSRWSQFFTVPDGDALAISLVAGQVEIHRHGQLLISYDAKEGLPDEDLARAIALRTSLPDDLMAGLKAFVRVGLAREAAFTDEALVLSELLFPELGSLSLDETKKKEVVAIIGFDPDEHPPLPGERVFADAYGIPGRVRVPEPEPASLELPPDPE